jgi:hypothetical protein
MQTLNEIFVECQTDKQEACHSYAKYYELFFEPLRQDSNVSLLEIGIDSGFSLRAWHKYFEKGDISGIDLRGNYEYLIEEGCKATYIVDQSSEQQLIDFNAAHRNEYNIIIDDGSHNCIDQIRSFEILFEGLQVGGFYCIEDELCSYDGRWNKGANTYDRVRRMIGEVSYNGKMSTDSLCSNKMGEIHKYRENLTYFEAHIEWLHQSCGLTIIKKM